MHHKLKLDHDGVYWGAEPIAENDVQPGDIVLDHAPDNPPGRYKWNGAEKRLEALPASQVKHAQEGPTLEQAFYEFVSAGRTERVRAWLAWFEKTIDERSKH